MTQSRRYTTFPSTGRRSSPPNIVDPRDTQENRMRSWRSRRDRCTRLTGPRVYLPDTSNKIVPSIDRNIHTKEEGYNNREDYLQNHHLKREQSRKLLLESDHIRARMRKIPIYSHEYDSSITFQDRRSLPSSPTDFSRLIFV